MEIITTEQAHRGADLLIGLIKQAEKQYPSHDPLDERTVILLSGFEATASWCLLTAVTSSSLAVITGDVRTVSVASNPLSRMTVLSSRSIVG